jgi:hypothetical protein
MIDNDDESIMDDDRQTSDVTPEDGDGWDDDDGALQRAMVGLFMVSEMLEDATRRVAALKVRAYRLVARVRPRTGPSDAPETEPPE